MSIPTSLIVVVLVLAWLVVLVPMVARRREAVPEAEMAGGTFRVLQRSGEMKRRGPVFRRRPAGDDGEDVAGEQVSGDQELDEELLDDEYDEYDDADGYDTDEDERDEYGEAYDEYDTDSDDVPAMAESAPVVAASGVAGGRRSGGSHPYRSDERVTAGSHPYRPEARQGSFQVDDDPEPAGYRSDDRQSASYDDEAADDHSDWADARTAPAQHADDVHLRPIPRRAGRGGYDPDAAEVARQIKYSRRRRVAVVLLLAALVFSAAAVLINPVLWAGTAVFGLLLIGFLAYLRRQVQIEANIRERRLARLRRARQIRPEYDMHRGESFVAASPFVAGPVPASQPVPSGFRRGRQIVDLDDDDPSFEDLEYYQPLTYRRASGQ